MSFVPLTCTSTLLCACAVHPLVSCRPFFASFPSRVPSLERHICTTYSVVSNKFTTAPITRTRKYRRRSPNTCCSPKGVGSAVLCLHWQHVSRGRTWYTQTHCTSTLGLIMMFFFFFSFSFFFFRPCCFIPRSGFFCHAHAITLFVSPSYLLMDPSWLVGFYLSLRGQAAFVAWPPAPPEHLKTKTAQSVINASCLRSTRDTRIQCDVARRNNELPTVERKVSKMRACQRTGRAEQAGLSDQSELAPRTVASLLLDAILQCPLPHRTW